MSKKKLAAALDENVEVIEIDPSDGLAEGCPIRALGHSHEIFYFTNDVGEVVRRGVKDFTAPAISGMFGGDVSWLMSNYQPSSKSRNDQEGWSAAAARNDLMRACRRRGFFNPVTDLRGPGIWANDDGLIVHAGNQVARVDIGGDGKVNFGDWQDAGGRIGDHIYSAALGEEKPAAEAAGKDEAAEVLDALRSWTFQSPGSDPELVLGWICCGMMAGALRIRPILWVVGSTTDGKSSLLAAISNVIGPAAKHFEKATEPGVRRVLVQSRACRAVALDEFETSDDNKGVQKLIEMARLSYDSRQGNVVIGGAEGGESKYDSIFVFVSVEPPPILPQDRNRHVVINLGPLNVSAAAVARFEDQVLPRLVELSPRLRRRMIERWPVYRDAVRAFSAAMIEASYSSRSADTYAPLIAASWAMLSDDDMPEQIDIDNWIKTLGLSAVAARQDAASSGGECWNHLIASSLEAYRSGEPKVVGEVLYSSAFVPGSFDEETTAKRAGLKVYKDKSDNQWIAIANRHPSLDKIFAGTRWKNGAWVNPLRQHARQLGMCPASGAASGVAVRFSDGLRVHATVISVAVLKDEYEAVEAEDKLT